MAPQGLRSCTRTLTADLLGAVGCKVTDCGLNLFEVCILYNDKIAGCAGCFQYAAVGTYQKWLKEEQVVNQ